MDRFDREIRSKINRDLEKEVHFSSAERIKIQRRIREHRNKKLSFNPIYWTVLVSAVGLMMVFGLIYMGDRSAAPTTNFPAIAADEEEKQPTSAMIPQKHESALPEEREWTKEDAANPKSGMYQMEVSEFANVAEYLTVMTEHWHHGDDSGDPEIDRKISIAFTTISYLNYYEKELQEFEATAIADELQRIALAISMHYSELTDEELRVAFHAFEEQLADLNDVIQ